MPIRTRLLRRLTQSFSGISTQTNQHDNADDNAQHHLHQTISELRESVNTLERQNIELDIAYRHALEASHSKSEFLANMSHEVRTPLNGIIGFCQLIARAPLEPQQQEWLSHIHTASDTLLALISDTLDFSKLEAGKMELECIDFDIQSLIDETLALQAPLAHHKRLHLLGLTHDEVPAQLQGDPLRIKQILNNLIHNAINFTDHGEVVVQAMLDDPDTCSSTLLVSVSDTGIGLSDEASERLFQPYHQANASDSRRYGGSGLGLAICRQLVEHMGGKISVESELGQGSTFTFTLALQASQHAPPPAELALNGLRIAFDGAYPATRQALARLFASWGAHLTTTPENNPPNVMIAELQSGNMTPGQLIDWQTRLDAAPCPCLLITHSEPEKRPTLGFPQGGELLYWPLSRRALAASIERAIKVPTSEQTTPDQAPLEQTPPRLLVVDDNAINRSLLEVMLEELGFDVHLATSGEEALALGRDEHFDLVLMDIRLPGMDGIATTQALRALDTHWQQCPVIAVTAHVMQGERQQLLHSGLQEVATKPLERDTLLALLRRYVPSHELSESADSTLPFATLEELTVVDLALGTRLAAGREALARDTLTLLINSLEASKAALQEAWKIQDAEAFLDAIHALNGACRYCGVPQLALVVETIETRLRSRGLVSIGTLLEALYTAMAQLEGWQSQQAFDTPHPSRTTNASAMPPSSDSDR